MLVKNKKVILKTKDQKHIKMNDIQNNEIVETKPQDNRLKSFIARIGRLEDQKNNILADIKEVY